MSDLMFIRHAETDMAGRFCGHADPPINKRGEQQIRHLLTELEPGSISAVYCSDLLRATMTADAFSRAFAVPIFLRPRLREIHFGDWEGLSWSEIERRGRSYAQEWIAAFPNLPAPGGEPFADFESRVLEELDELLHLKEHKQIAIVSHGGVMRVVLRKLHGCSEREAWNRTEGYCSYFVHQQGKNSSEVGL